MDPTKTKLACPVCEASFVSPLVLDYHVARKDPDLCPTFDGDNPLPQLIHACPVCGYCGFQADYAIELEDSQRDRLSAVLKSLGHDPNQPPSGAERFRRAALIGAYLGKQAAEIAELYLQSSWCSQLDNEPDAMARHARRKAVQYFEAAMQAGEFQPTDLPTVVYLVGELKRRNGKFTEALIDFAKLDDYPFADHEVTVMRDRQRDSIRRAQVQDPT